VTYPIAEWGKTINYGKGGTARVETKMDFWISRNLFHENVCFRAHFHKNIGIPNISAKMLLKIMFL
jgi:hypothetical protein